MRGTRDNLPVWQVFLLGKTYELSRQGLEVGRENLALTKAMHEKLCAPPAKWETVARFGRLTLKALRLFGPLLQPHIMPWLAWIPAGVVAFWKLFLRDFLGW